MKTTILLNQSAPLACGSAFSRWRGVRAVLQRRTFLRARKRFAGAMIIDRCAVMRFKSIRQSEAG